MSDDKTVAAPANDANGEDKLPEENIDLARRAFALRNYEQAVELYADALEKMTERLGDDHPELADLYFSYGKALLENAISQTAVLGKEEAEEAIATELENPSSGSGSKDGNAPFLSFSGDAEDDGDLLPQGDEDRAVDLFAEAQKAVEREEKEVADAAEAADADEDGGEPEDDFNAAWEVLDLARALYEKQKDDDDEVKLKLADTYIALGDVSLETEKFDQAISDYDLAAALKSELLPVSSRQIAEAHYKLCLALDLTSGRLGDAITHAEKALISVESRLAELRNGLSGQKSVSTEKAEKPPSKGKGKGKAAGATLVKDDVAGMTKQQMEAEVKELDELREDLALKVEELKTLPEDHAGAPLSAPAIVAKELDKELNAASSSSKVDSTKVNDLTTAVKKKKKGPTANGKRKAEEEPSVVPEKKVKADE